MQAIRKIGTREIRGMLEDGGSGALVPGPGEERVVLEGVSVAEVQARASRAAKGPAGRTVLHDDGTVEADPAIPTSETSLVDAIRRGREGKGLRPDAPVTLEELAEAERKVRGG